MGPPSVQPRVEPHHCSLVNKSGNEMRSSERVRELSSSHSKAMVSSRVAASEASWHHRTKKGVSRLEGKYNIWLLSDCLSPGWQPDVAIDCNMEAIRGSVAFQEGWMWPAGGNTQQHGRPGSKEEWKSPEFISPGPSHHQRCSNKAFWATSILTSTRNTLALLRIPKKRGTR